MLAFLLGCALITDDDYAARVDADGDGAIAATYGGGDCDDASASIHPGAEDGCDAVDNDCDGETDEDATFATLFADTDGDSFGDATSGASVCGEPVGLVADSTDCDDTNVDAYPGAAEGCESGADLNCDGALPSADVDADGSPACEDCDDANNAVFPGAVEVCNGVDDDCSGTADDGATDAAIWYEDGDEDGFGLDASTVSACERPDGYAAAGGDCDDSRADTNPAEDEDCGATEDLNCDGFVGLGDNDGDGWSACEECDDGNADINPDATEICNDIDDDCSGAADDNATDAPLWYVDADGDTYGDSAAATASCNPVSGSVALSGDCDDANKSAHPGAVEVCDDFDDDCDGSVDVGAADATDWYADADEDTYGDAGTSVVQCDAPSGFVVDNTDCDDSRADVNPAGVEVCDGADTDENCNGAADTDDPTVTDAAIWYADTDADTYGDFAVWQSACEAPAGFVADATDCDDTDSGTSPVAAETCNGTDNNCSGDETDASDALTWYEDADGDGYGLATSTTLDCTLPTGYSADNRDCDDSDSASYPFATEVLGDGIDEDCDGYDNPARSCPFDCESTTCLYVDGVLQAEQTTGFDTDMASIDNLAVSNASFDDVKMHVNGALVVDEDFSAGVGCFATGATSAGEFVPASGDNDCALTAFDATTSEWAVAMHMDNDWTSLPCAYAQLESGTTGTGVGANWCFGETGGYLNDGAGTSFTFADTFTSGTAYDLAMCGYEPGTDADGDGWVAQSDRGPDCDDTDATVYPDAPEVTTDSIDQDCDGFAQFVDEDFDSAAAGDAVVGTSSWVCVGASCLSTYADTQVHSGGLAAYTNGGSGEFGWPDARFSNDFDFSLWFYDTGYTGSGDFITILYKGVGAGKSAQEWAGWETACGTNYCTGDASSVTSTLGARSEGWHQMVGSVHYTSALAGVEQVCIDGSCAAGVFSGIRTYIGFNDDHFYGYVDDFRAWVP